MDHNSLFFLNNRSIMLKKSQMTLNYVRMPHTQLLSWGTTGLQNGNCHGGPG